MGATAIHAADAGISVQEATEVARAAADLILLAPNLGMLAEGVEEGRRTYADVMKYVRMGTSSNSANMLSMAMASLVIPFLLLLPVQILLNNLLYDLSEIGIPFDAVDRRDLARPHSWNMRQVLRFTLVMGPLSSTFDLATFALLLWSFGATPEEFRTAWFIESMATQILVIFLIRTAGPAWRARPVLGGAMQGAGTWPASMSQEQPHQCLAAAIAACGLQRQRLTLGPTSVGCLVAADLRAWAVGRMRQGSPNQKAHDPTDFRPPEFASSIKPGDLADLVPRFGPRKKAAFRAAAPAVVGNPIA